MAKYEDESDRKTNGISELFKTNFRSSKNIRSEYLKIQ